MFSFRNDTRDHGSWFARSAVICVCSTFFMNACSQSSAPHSTNIAKQYGLRETKQFQETAERAIGIANIILGGNEKVRFVPSWISSGIWCPSLEFTSNPNGTLMAQLEPERNNCRFVNMEAVPIYLIDDDQLPSDQSTFIPAGERCVFINARDLTTFFEELYLSPKTEIQHVSSFEQALLLAAVLLHESGHLHYKDTESTSPKAATAELKTLLRPSAQIDDVEFRADRFATEQITTAWLSNDDRPFPSFGFGRHGAASKVQRVIETISNSHGLRTDPLGLLKGQVNRAPFHVQSYSHPNLYLRFLVMLYQLEPKEQRLAYIRDILTND